MTAEDGESGAPLTLPAALVAEMREVEQAHTYETINAVFEAIQRAEMVLVPKCFICPAWDGQECGGCYLDLSAYWHPTTEEAAMKQAPVQGNPQNGYVSGSVEWWEHEQAYEDYARRYGTRQNAEGLAQRGGFSYGELVDHLGHEPETWKPRGES